MTDSQCQRSGVRARCSPARERDRVQGSRELSGSRFTEAAGVGLIRRHKAGFRCRLPRLVFLDRQNAIQLLTVVHRSLRKKRISKSVKSNWSRTTSSMNPQVCQSTIRERKRLEYGMHPQDGSINHIRISDVLHEAINIDHLEIYPYSKKEQGRDGISKHRAPSNDRNLGCE